MSSVGCNHSSREDVCVCGRRRIVDAQQSTPAQHREDWSAVVCDEPSATSDPTWSHTRRQRFCSDCRLGTRLGHLYLDSEASTKIHVSRTVSSCFSVLLQLRFIRRSVTRPVLQSLVVSLVLSRLDYGNATLAGLPGRELNRLQSVLNAAARLIFAASKYDHVTPLLSDLHWLRVPERIDFKITVLVYRCLCGLAPAYLSTELQSVKDMPSRQRLRSWSSDTLTVPMSRLSTVGNRRRSNALYTVIGGTILERSACGRYLVDYSASF